MADPRVRRVAEALWEQQKGYRRGLEPESFYDAAEVAIAAAEGRGSHVPSGTAGPRPGNLTLVCGGCGANVVVEPQRDDRGEWCYPTAPFAGWRLYPPPHLCSACVDKEEPSAA